MSTKIVTEKLETEEFTILRIVLIVCSWIPCFRSTLFQLLQGDKGGVYNASGLMGVNNTTPWASSSGDGSIGYDVMPELRQPPLSLVVVRSMSAWLNAGKGIVVALGFGVKVRCPRCAS